MPGPIQITAFDWFDADASASQSSSGAIWRFRGLPFIRQAPFLRRAPMKPKMGAVAHPRPAGEFFGLRQRRIQFVADCLLEGERVAARRIV